MRKRGRNHIWDDNGATAERVTNAPQASRVDWVDYAKGFCIVMVVMMHSTLGVEQAAGHEGWMHAAVAFARPFRMPDFFLISGLFLARVIDRDWRDLSRQQGRALRLFLCAVGDDPVRLQGADVRRRAWAGAASACAYLEAFIEPFGTLWFIYLLPIFFVVAKLTRGLPWLAIWLVGAALEIAHIDTGWTVIDEFAHRFVYFYTGYVFAPHIFALAARVQRKPMHWRWPGSRSGRSSTARWCWPAMPTGRSCRWRLGFAGAGAVVAVAALMARSDVFRPLRYCGQNSIVIYLAFFLPMAATRIALLKTGIIADLGTISLLVTAAGVVGALAWYWAVRGTPLRFLFERPAWARLKPARIAAHAAGGMIHSSAVPH